MIVRVLDGIAHYAERLSVRCLDMAERIECEDAQAAIRALPEALRPHRDGFVTHAAHVPYEASGKHLEVDLLAAGTELRRALHEKALRAWQVTNDNTARDASDFFPGYPPADFPQAARYGLSRATPAAITQSERMTDECCGGFSKDSPRCCGGC